MHGIKHTIIDKASIFLNDKLKDLNAMMDDLNEASKNETKSTVGDKHETSKAMMHLEQEKLGSQIKEIESQIKEFNAINFSTVANNVVLGSLVKTTKGYFFIAAAIGKMQIDDKSIFVISNKSPLGLKLIGLKENDSIEFNTINYLVKSIN